MELTSLSASSADLFEKCPSRWAAEYAGRAEQISNAAADKGTVVHATLQQIVERGLHLDHAVVNPAELVDLYSECYESVFADRSEYDDGLDMVRTWWDRCDAKYWQGREVLSTEVKRYFEVPSPEGPIPFNYIFDRVDRVGTEIEVVDYKSWRVPKTVDELRHKTQAKAYALAAYLEYPTSDRVWVTFDQLRHEPVGMVFTPADLEEFSGYLARLAARMVESNGNEEILNEDCRYCVRKLQCRALATNAAHGGTLSSLMDVAAAAVLREKVAWRAAGLATLLEEIDRYIVNDLKRMDLLEYIDAERGIEVALKLKSRRSVDGQRGADIIGPELMRRYGKLNVGDVDKLLKSPELTQEQKNELRRAIMTNWSNEPTPQIRHL